MSDKLLVIFDFDGTLADTWDLVAEELASGADRFRYRKLDRRQLEGLRRLETREVFRTLGVTWWRLPRLVAHLRGRAEVLADRIGLFAGIGDVILALDEAGHALAIVSSNSEAVIRRVLGPELAPRIRLFACSSSIFGKAAKFRRLLRQARRCGLPHRTVAVGDETRDLDAAESAGLASLAVEWGYNEPALLRSAAPGRTAATPADLLAMLDRYAEAGRFG